MSDDMDDIFGAGWYAKASARFSILAEKRRKTETRNPRPGCLIGKGRPPPPKRGTTLEGQLSDAALERAMMSLAPPQPRRKRLASQP